MFSVFETVDDTGKRSVFGAPDIWEENVILRWLPKSRNINVFRKSHAVPDDDWYSFSNYKVLSRNLSKSADFDFFSIIHYLFYLKLPSGLVWLRKGRWNFTVTLIRLKKLRKEKL